MQQIVTYQLEYNSYFVGVMAWLSVYDSWDTGDWHGNGFLIAVPLWNEPTDNQQILSTN